MTNNELLKLVILQKKYSDCKENLEKILKNWENEENMRFTEDQLRTSIFVLGRISKHLSSKIDNELY